MSTLLQVEFTEVEIHHRLDGMSDEALDALNLGVIGFGADTLVRRYNAFESQMAGLSRGRVLGTPLFSAVAPCMNNFLVALRFEDAVANARPLDAIIDYVFTLRMRPSKVKLRLLSTPGRDLNYILVARAPS